MTAHTPGPWTWSVSPKSHTVELSHGQYGNSVMRFARWNLSGATPLFRRDGVMVRAVDLSVVEPGREHHADWWRLIDHPDARLIAASPALLQKLTDLRHHFICRCDDAYLSRNRHAPECKAHELADIDAAIASATGGGR